MLVLEHAPRAQEIPHRRHAHAVLHKKPKNPEHAAVAMDFFKWTEPPHKATAQALALPK
jgi:hypothetical protein